MIDQVNVDHAGNITVRTAESVVWNIPYTDTTTSIKGINKEITLEFKSYDRLPSLSLLNPEIASLASALLWTFGNYLHDTYKELTAVYRETETVLTFENNASLIVLVFDRKYHTMTVSHSTGLTTRKKTGCITDMKKTMLDCAVTPLDCTFLQTLFNRGVFTIA